MSLDTWREIALNLPVKDIIHLCQATKESSKICDSNYFWEQVYKINYGDISFNDKTDWEKEVKEEYTKQYIIGKLNKKLRNIFPSIKWQKDKYQFKIKGIQEVNTNDIRNIRLDFPSLNIDFLTYKNDIIITYSYKN